MMKKLNIIILIALIFINVSNLFAQQSQAPQLKFSGKIINGEKKESYNKIHITYNTNDWFSKSGFENIVAKIDINGNFEFNLPDLNKPYKISMVIMAMNSPEPKKLWNGNYYVESKDDVKLQILLQEDFAIFSGMGSEKYNLVSKLSKQFYDEYFQELGSTKLLHSSENLTELNLKMDKLAGMLRRYKEKKLNLISTAKISPNMKIILNNEYARYSEEWQFRTELTCKANPNYRRQAFAKYLYYSKEFFDKPDSLSLFCPVYLYGLSLRDAFKQIINENSDKVNIISFYNTRKANYSGALRDRLIASCFFTNTTISQFAPYTSFIMDSLLKDASRIVLVPYIKKAIVDQIAKLDKVKPGTKLYESEFIGLDGKKFDLKSLRGKVIMIDTWFNGCFGCASFHKVFEKDVYPRFKDNKNFVLISINIDDKKDRWLKGIDSKRYTSKEHVNVWTGNGIDHPFMKYYSIIGAPYLMLVDLNGNISYKPDNGTSSVQKWITQINSALNVISSN